MAPTKTKLRVKKKDGGGKSSQRLLASASPDSKCPICLDGFNNVASLDRCLHQFCFRCIHEWSKNKAECPLCKQPFHSIFHSVNGQDDFKEFVLRPPETQAPPAGNPPERLLRPRVLRERRSHRLRPPVPPVPPAPSPPDDDIMFGGFSAALTENQDVRRMVRRLTARRSGRGEGRGEGRSLRRLRDQDVVAFRRALYRTGVRARNARDGGRPRDVSAAFLRQNPACLRRLLPWLQRELTVLYGSHGSLVNIVQHIIMSRITNYNMEDSAIRDELRPFLLARTDHFLHELVSFARSTLSMEVYDQQAIYDCPAPSYEEGSSSNSSVIAISEDDDSEHHATENPSVLQHPPPTNPHGLPSESGWDDETPGPSYSTLLPSSSQSQDEAPEPSILTDPPLKPPSLSDGPDDDEEECLIVGYVKPMAERTPELVQLSSDSSEEEQEAPPTDTKATVTKSEPQTHVAPRSPAPSAGPAPSHSPSPQDHRSRLATGGAIESSARKNSRAGSPDPSWSDWGASEPSPASSVPERLAHSSWDDDRGRKRRRKSPESIAVSCRRKRRRRSVSISSSSAERSRPDKPGGKRKYKTRHLERAARRQRGERSAGKRNRSPSVEIVFERKANDSQRKKRRKRKQRSPTVITIDSDSDRTIDCLHRVIDQTPTGSDCEQESARFVEAPALAPIGSLDLDDCVVDVVNHDGSHGNILPTGHHTASFPDLTTPPTADSRLLESILQDLEDFLPGVEKEEEEEEEESSLTQTPNQQIKQCSI